MTVLAIVESYFGHTTLIAEAISSGLAEAAGPVTVTRVPAADAPREIPQEVSLLLVGAPTHNMSLPGPPSRRQAAEKGATAGQDVGIQEWIELAVPRADLRVVTFDTSMKTRFMPSFTAARSAYKSLRRRGFRAAERGPSFYVTDVGGPLAEGEEERAVAWGIELASTLRKR